MPDSPRKKNILGKPAPGGGKNRIIKFGYSFP